MTTEKLPNLQSLQSALKYAEGCLKHDGEAAVYVHVWDTGRSNVFTVSSWPLAQSINLRITLDADTTRIQLVSPEEADQIAATIFADLPMRPAL